MTRTPDAAAEIDALLLPVGTEWHALELSLVREVLPVSTLTVVPDAPAWLEGLVNIRGDVVPVVTTAAALRVKRGGPATHLIVADTARGQVAVAASGTPQTGVLGAQTGSGSAGGARSHHLVGDVLCTLIDLDEVTGAP